MSLIKAAASAAIFAGMLFAPNVLLADNTIYSNNFSSNALDFSDNTLSTTPGTGAHPADGFLGEFSNHTTTLTLTGIGAHTHDELSFDVYVIRSWDGDAEFGGGPGDGFSLTENGSTLLNTNFANYPGNTQQFQTQANPNAGNQAPETGASEVNTLGYTFNGTPMDSVYHFDYLFNDSSSNLVINFNGSPNEDITNESWGLDNVIVTADTGQGVAGTPEPGSLAMFAGLGVSVLVAARKRRDSSN